MRDVFDKDISEVRVILAKVKRDMSAFDSEITKATSEVDTLEEQCRLTEEQIQNSMLELRSADREISRLKQEIRQRKLLTKPDMHPLDSLEKFVTISETVFAADRPKTGKESIFEANLKQSSSEALKEVSEAAQAILRLKKDIPLLVKAEKELGKRKREERRPRVEEVLHTDVLRVAENSILVYHMDTLGQRQECQFPVTSPEGYKMTFAELLLNACRYWMRYEGEFVLIDREYRVLPGTSTIDEELSPADRVVTLVPKDELEQGKASAEMPLLQRVIGKELYEEEFDPPAKIDKSQTIETSRIDQETFNAEEERLQKLKRMNEKLQLIQRRRLLNVINLLIYIVFVVMFTWVLTETNNIFTNFNLRKAIRGTVLMRQFPDYGNDGFTFYDIVNEKHFQMFMQQPFMTLFVEGTETQRYFFNGSLRKVGPIRLVQKRVKNKSCSYEDYNNSLGNIRGYCFADYSQGVEETADLYLPGIKNEYLSWTKFRHRSSPRKVTATKMTYDLEGYEVYLAPNAPNSEVAPIMDYLLANWLDRQTRLLVIDINLCNQNVDTCVAFEIIFEFLAGGTVVQTEYFYQYRVNRNWTVSDKVRAAFEYTIDVIMIYFLFTIVQECRRIGFRQGIKQFWLLMEVLLIVMIFVRQLLIIIYEQQELIRDFHIDTPHYQDLMAPAYIYKLLTNFEGVALFLAFMTMFKFLQNSSSMSIIWGTLMQSMLSVIFFFLVFSLVFMGWVLLCYKLYGKDTIDYKSIGSSANTLMQVILGNNDLDNISAFDPTSASLFFILFSFLNNFVMLNIFLAIINESYDTVYKRLKKAKKDELLIILGMIFKGFKMALIDLPLSLLLLKPCRKKQSNLESSTDSGKPRELTIEKHADIDDEDLEDPPKDTKPTS